MKKIVFFDIDGTLIDDATQTLPESALEAVAALRRQGHLAILNTGRPYSHIDPRVLQGTWDGCVCGCGMEVRAGNRTLHQVLPDPALCRRMRELVRACNLDPLFEANGCMILDGTRPQGPQVKLEAQRMAAKGIPVTLDPDRPDFTFEKLVVFDLGQADMTRFQAEAGRDFTLIARGGGMTEAVLLGNSKSTGIHRILDHYHLSREAAFAFGDSANDLPMFQCVATPIAMGGSPLAVQQTAVYTTGTVLENGIQQGLRHFGLI